MTVRVLVRDGSLRPVAEMDAFTDLDVTVRQSDVGGWSVTCPADSPAALALTYSGGIIVQRNGRTLLSGPVAEMTVNASSIDSRRRPVEMLTATGPDDTDVLAGRLALPIGPFGPTSGYDVRTGTVEGLLYAYADANAGPGAPIADRRVPGLVMAPSLERGPQITTAPDRYENLLVFLRKLAGLYGLSFRVVQDGTARRFEVRQPVNRTADVVFGLDRGNLLGYEYRTARAGATYVYAGGQGELAARQIVEVASDTGVSLYGRRETFADYSNAPDAITLQDKALETLYENADDSALKIEPIDGPDSTLGVDYEIGDTVSVRLRGGAVLRDRVAQVRLQISDGKETFTPTVASDGTNVSGVALVQMLRSVGRRLTRLEGR